MDKRDFSLLSRELRQVLREEHRIASSTSRFSLRIKHQCFLIGQQVVVGEYYVMFERHDEVVNVRALDLDREVWLMLLCYPLDARSFSCIARAISNFAVLNHVHESVIQARVIVQAVLHDERRIPPDVVVSTGTGPRTESFTVPVYVLSSQNAVAIEDEQPIPPQGPPHPIPPPAPRWIGTVGNVPQGHMQAEESQVGDAPMSNVQDPADADMGI